MEFASEAAAVAKELELRNSTKCVNAATKTDRYSDIIVRKDGTALLAIEPVYNHETKTVVDVANTLLTAPEKSALKLPSDPTVKSELNQDPTAIKAK